MIRSKHTKQISEKPVGAQQAARGRRTRAARAPLTPAQRFARDVLPWIIIVVLVLGVFCYRAISDTMREQGVLSIRSSIINAAEQCYAIEGAYPSSLNQLMEQYGIRYDKNKYVVNYNVFAANVPPTVTVTAR